MEKEAEDSPPFKKIGPSFVQDSHSFQRQKHKSQNQHIGHTSVSVAKSRSKVYVKVSLKAIAKLKWH